MLRSLQSRPSAGATVLLLLLFSSAVRSDGPKADPDSSALSNKAPKVGDPGSTGLYDKIPILNAEKAAELEALTNKVRARVTPAVVRVWIHNEDGKAFDEKGNPLGGSGSGVIIRKDGLILSCAHHGFTPGTKCTVEMADGKRVKGQFLGLFELAREGKTQLIGPDLGLVKIEEKGPWPFAPVGPAERPQAGSICLSIGYPGILPPGSPPLPRIGRVMAGGQWISVSVCGQAGDSGGPLFDLDARVVGIFKGGHWSAPEYQPVAPLARHLEALEAGKVVSEFEPMVRRVHCEPLFRGPFAAAEDLHTKMLYDGLCAVRIMDGSTEIAAGLAVDPGGWVVTKRSLVDGRNDLNCGLSWTLNAELYVAAKVVATSLEHDLALLRLDAAHVRRIDPDGLRVPRWGESPHLGQFVVVPRGKKPHLYGMVGTETTKEDSRTRLLNLEFKVKEGPNGEPVATGEEPSLNPEADNFRRAFQAGDIITHLNGVPTPTLKEFHRVNSRLRFAQGTDGELIQPYTRAPGALAGEPVMVAVQRGGKEFNIRITMTHTQHTSPVIWNMAPMSLRRDGFPAVFAHNAWVSPEQCGGPLLDMQGRVIGLNIARADPTRTLAIPVDVLRKIVDEMRKSVKEGDAKAGQEK